MLAARSLTEHRLCTAAYANVFLVPSTAGQLHGILGQAPPFFQVLVRVCPEPASLPGPPRWGQAPLWPERQVLEGEISDAVVVFARAAETLALRRRSIDTRPGRATHLSIPPKHHQKTRPNQVVR